MTQPLYQRPPGAYTVLLPARTPEKIRQFLPLADALAKQNNGRIVLLGVVETDDRQSPEATEAAIAEQRAVYTALLTPDSVAAPVQSSIVVAANLAEGIRAAVGEHAADLLVLGWRAEQSSSERLFGQPINALLRQPPCDMIVARLRGDTPWQRILLPVRGGPHTALACDIAIALAEASDAMISVLYAANPRRPDDAAVRESLQDLRTMHRVTRWLERTIAVDQAIRAEAADHEAIVLGVTGRRDDPEAPLGPIADRLLRQVDRSIILVRHAMAPTEEQAQQLWQHQYDLTATVDRWFAANTFGATEYTDPQELLTLKRRQGLTVSLVLPTPDGAGELEPTLADVHAELHLATPLLDEIVLIDGDVGEAPPEDALIHGAHRHRHAALLPQYGSFAGKGEALWKSLYICRGDIIVWCDPTVSAVHPQVVLNVLGPLLNNPALVYSKGFYQRTIEAGEPIVVSGGGRLTELTARPLLNLFYPELAGMLQPLAGAFAGRRTALETVPMFTGYGMEVGLLIDLLEQYGLEALAQVEMIEPTQRRQETAPRSRIAFAITQVILQRVEQRQKISLIDDLSQTLKLITRQSEGGYHLELRALRDHERPPMVHIPEYRRLRGLE